MTPASFCEPSPEKHGIFDIQAGAGIVPDSIAAAEYDETMNKAKAILKAVEIAEKRF